jgi:hypothetical protein
VLSRRHTRVRGKYLGFPKILELTAFRYVRMSFVQRDRPGGGGGSDAAGFVKSKTRELSEYAAQ